MNSYFSAIRKSEESALELIVPSQLYLPKSRAWR